jgi:hypothetical protein
MTSLFYNDDTSLTLAGYAELQRLVLGYCKDKGYAPWRFGFERDNSLDAVEQWRQGLLAALADHLRAKVWVQRWTALDGEEKLWLYLSEGEGQAKLKRHGGPIRHRSTLAIIKTQWPRSEQPWHTVPVQTATLAELLINKVGIDELIYRLGKHVVAPYSAADWQALRKRFGAAIGTVWSDMNREPRSVAFASAFFEDSDPTRLAVLLPSAWGIQPDDSSGFGSFGKDLRIDPNHMFAFFDANHRYRFAQLTSPWHPTIGDPMGRAYCVGEATYAYLQTDYCGMGIYEASHEPLQPDRDGDWLCKLMTQGEIQLNNPDHSVLAGSLSRDGCVVKCTLSDSRLLGWLPLETGDFKPERQSSVRQRAQLRWADLQSSSEGLRPAQDPKSLLWGWANDEGGLAIEPRFARVGQFHHGLAQVSSPEDPKMFGLVNRVGDWVMAPQWAFITWSSPRFMTVRNDGDEWGAMGFSVDEGGKVVGRASMVLPLQTENTWLEIFSQQLACDEQRRQALRRLKNRRVLDEKPNMSRTDMVMAAIKRVAQDRVFQTVQQAKQEASLGRLAGEFDASSARDLMATGVWSMHVRVLRDQDKGFRIRAGETGNVFTQYPVSLSTYDLNQEAPVMGLQSASHAVIGVPWEDLCWIASKEQ